MMGGNKTESAELKVICVVMVLGVMTYRGSSSRHILLAMLTQTYC